ncbi:O-antigen ligase family protein [Natronobacterium lacisalsi]|nr:O-antigen ligase family protein [Halobiforma lacisalsi]
MEVSEHNSEKYLNETISYNIKLLFLGLVFFIPVLSVFRPEDLIILLFLAGIALPVQFSYSHLVVPRLALYLVPFIIFISICMVYQSVFLNIPVAPQSVTELLHPLRIIAIIVFIYYLTEEPRHRYHITLLIVLFTLLASLLSLIQSGLILYLGPEAVPFVRYYAGVHVDTLINQTRIFGTAVNPNRFAILLVPGIVISTSLLYHHYYNRNYNSWLVCLCIFTTMVGFFTLVFTQSRTGLIALIAALAISFALMFYSENEGIGKILFFVIFGIILFTLLLYFGFLPNRYNVLLQVRDLSTLGIRFEIWRDLFRNFESNTVTYFIGHGPNWLYFKEFGGTDGEWISIIFRYGISGAFVFTLFYAAIVRRSTLVLHGNGNGDSIDKLLASVSIGLVAAAILYGITDQIVYNQRIITLFVTIWATTVHASVRKDSKV